MKKRYRSIALILLCLLVIAGCLIGKPAYLWVNAWLHDQPRHEELPLGYTDDASRLNRTPVAEIRSIPSNPAAAEAQLRELLARAKQDRLPVSIAGARHSGGGHTIAPRGIVLDMLRFNHMELDLGAKMLHVGAGARWSEIIPYLDARGLAVSVMQSNNNFSVGGSLSVNCHGWQPNRPPIASTVESFRLMKVNGEIVRCSRKENQELFSLVLGGYGLFGIILDVDLRVASNACYRAEVDVLPSSAYVDRFAEKVDGRGDIGLAFGRLCIVPGEKFLRDSILTVFRDLPNHEIPPLKAAGYETLRREVYRAQIGSLAGREMRWKAESTLSAQMSKRYFSRNQLMNEPAEVYQEQNKDRTDILHEYFMPPNRFTGFLERMREVLPKHDVELMNVTIRNIKQDNDSWLRYADQDMFSLVLLFNQPLTQEADAIMEALTRELVDAALQCEGRYYLPYRLHANLEQFRKAYPQADGFFKKKRQYDPDEILQNQFYIKYGK
jgi:FAD/FMN-containing dehydrogenase